MKKKLFMVLIMLALVVSAIPMFGVSAAAAGDPNTQVYVSAENNTTYTVSSGAAWEGRLFEVWVDYDAGDTMMDAVTKALTETNAEAVGVESNYITSLDGLTAFDGGAQSGWMGTINDWFPDAGFNAVSVVPGDEIRLLYTTDWGEDIGGMWGVTDTRLHALEASAGVLSPAFNSDTTAYTLTVPSGTTDVSVLPTAIYKNYQVRTYLGLTYSAADSGYKRTESIPITDGSVITVVCGDPSWPSMNDPATASVYTITIDDGDPYADYMEIKIPEDGTMTLGSKVKHYYPYTAANKIAGPVENTDGTVSYYYDLVTNASYTYEIKLSGKAKYAGTFKMTAALLDSGMTFTDEQIAASADYISRDLASNKYNVSSILLNGNQKGYLELDSAESYALHPLRDWQAVEATITSTNTPIVEPEYHYTVYNLDVNGISDDDGSIITVNEQGLIEAVGEGTAIVLVTYDALYETASIYSGTGGLFSAIWPENTGVIVVGVDQTPATFATNMTINMEANIANAGSKREGHHIDAETDVLYYLPAEDGATYSFTPEAGSTVTLLRPAVSSTAMTYSGNFGTNGVAEESGTYTLTLKEGRNIVRIEKDGEVTYQIITAKKVFAAITNETNVGSDTYEAGDTVKVVFNTLYHPANKLAAIYNFSARAGYTAENGAAVNGTANQYQFASTAGCQTLTFTIPADWTENSYTLNDGSIYVSGFGSMIGEHRDIDWINGHSAAFNAQMRTAYMGALPDITISVGVEEAMEPAIDAQPEGSEYTEGDAANALSVTASKADDGVLSYQWQSSSDNVNFTDIATATSSSYTPDTAIVGTTYYRVVVTNTLGASSKDAISESAAVVVKEILQTVDVEVSLQSENYFLMNPETITVRSTLAAEYGYHDEVRGGGISALDVLVRAHEIMLEEDFTPEDSRDWLTVSSTGFITKAFGESTSDFSFAINAQFPYDPESVYNPSVGYTGYSFANAPVSADDVVDFFYYQDSSFYMDYYTWFELEGTKTREITVTAGENVTVDLIGFWYMFGSYTIEDMVKMHIYGAIEDAQLSTVGIDGTDKGILSDITGATTDENGRATLCFDDAGTYYVSAYTDYTVAHQYIVSPWLKVEVEAAPEAAEPAIDAQPEGAEYTEGDAANALSVTASRSDNGVRSYQWQSSSDNVNFADIATATSSSYTPDIATVGTTYYRVVVTNTLGDSSKDVISESAAVTVKAPKLSYLEALSGVSAYLEAQVADPGVGSTFGEWVVLALNRGSAATSSWNDLYIDNLADYVAEKQGILSPSIYQYTEYSRVTLALTSLGIDARAFEASDGKSYDLVKPLTTKNGSNQHYATLQGINGSAFALLALNSAGYYSDDLEVRGALVDHIVGNKLTGGGWPISASGSFDFDTTAMVIQALAPYYRDQAAYEEIQGDTSWTDLKTAVDEALARLNTASWSSAESIAQLVVALSALDIDADREDWVAITELLTYYDKQGGAFSRGGSANQMTTEQAAYALVAYDRYKNDKTSLYDMSDVLELQDPVLSLTVETVKRTAAKTAAVTFSSNKAGSYYYEVVASGAAAPSIDVSGAGAPCVAGSNSFTVSGLTDEKAKDVYIVVKAGDEVSRPLKVTIPAHTSAPIVDPPTPVDPTDPSLNLEPEVTVNDGKATATVTDEELTGALDKAKEEEAPVITITPKHTDDATSVEITVPLAPIKEIAEDTEAAIEYVTERGTILIGQETLAKIAGESGSNFVVIIEELENGNIRVTVKVDEKVLADFPLVVKLPTANAASGHAAFLLDGSDERVIHKSYADHNKLIALIPGSTTLKVADKSKSFTDVASDFWGLQAIAFATGRDLFQGTSDTEFSPDGAMTRAMLVTVLWRLEGEPTPKGNNPFSDVESGQWYTNAVIWANEQKIVEGYGDGLFGTNDSVTREQIATMIHRYAKDTLGLDVSKSSDLNSFPDGSNTSSWAKTALEWAVGTEMIKGHDTGNIAPDGTATRAEVATMLMRFVQYMLK